MKWENHQEYSITLNRVPIQHCVVEENTHYKSGYYYPNGIVSEPRLTKGYLSCNITASTDDLMPIIYVAQGTVYLVLPAYSFTDWLTEYGYLNDGKLDYQRLQGVIKELLPI